MTAGVGKAEVRVGENLKVLFNYNQRQKGRDITYLVSTCLYICVIFHSLCNIHTEV